MLTVNNLKTYIDTGDSIVKPVDGVSFSVEQGQTLGVVGESGSGKSIMALSLMQLNPTPPIYYPSGEILFKDKNLLNASNKYLRSIRGGGISMIFQDPMTSLNPIYKIGKQIREMILAHKEVSKHEADKQAVKVLGDVGIASPEQRLNQYPHEFSGGMRQRVMIAMAISCQPELLIADEPTTALDVTIQSQILELLKDLQDRNGTSIIMITHDLGVVAQVADEVMVMYSGRAVEKGNANDIFYDPLMPYSWGLLQSIPKLDGEGERLIPIEGHPPNLSKTPKGCNFSPRCPFVKDECLSNDPSLEEKKKNHYSACILSPEEIEEKRSQVGKSEVRRENSNV